MLCFVVVVVLQNLYMDAVSIFLPVTFAILGEKTTVMSPEVFVTAGVPCCRYYYIDFYY